MSFWLEKRVVVTGGAGFIGHRIVRKLVDLGARITVIDDLSKGAQENLDGLLDRIDLIQKDLLDPEVTRDVLKDCEICFHLAARIGGIGYFHRLPATILRDNSIMNFNLWDAASSSNTKVVGLSSSMVFERVGIFPTPEEAVEKSPPPKTAYGFSKLSTEYVAKAYYDQFGVGYVIARPFNAYGPGEAPGDYVGYAHVIPDLVRKIFSGEYPLEILGSGKQTRCYTYVDDIADGIIYVAEKGENDIFNIGTSSETSVLELAEMIWKLSGRTEAFRVEHVPAYEDDVERRAPDTSKATSLGWVPRVNLNEGLERTVKWLRPRLVAQDHCRS